MKAKQISRLVILSTIVLAAGISGCNQTPNTGNIPVNEDSVRNHILPIREAIAYTKKFRNARDTFYRQLPPLQSGLNLGQAESFNRDAIAILLNQKDSLGNEAAGVRIYYGLDAGGQVRMILVPYDMNGNDIINQLIGNKAASIPGIPRANAFWADGQTVENGQRCPVVCSNSNSGLNGQ